MEHCPSVQELNIRNPARVIAKLTAVLMLGALSACLSSSTEPPIPLAQNVDMNRMYGGWYIVATIPNSFEKGMVAPYDVYTKRPDGNIREDFYVQRGGFHGQRNHLSARNSVKPGTGNAEWRVIWPLNLPFLVLYVDPDYRYVLYGEQNRKLGWIYARTPQVPEADYQGLLQRFQALGYDSTSFRKIVQRQADIGAPGFWSDKIRP